MPIEIEMPVKILVDDPRKQREKSKTRGTPQIYRNPDGKVGQQIKQSLFEHHSQNPKELSNEIIKADCMNHGYRLDGTIGEGAYAKVKLAHILAGKLARNPTMSDIVEESGELKVMVFDLGLPEWPNVYFYLYHWSFFLRISCCCCCCFDKER